MATAGHHVTIGGVMGTQLSQEFHHSGLTNNQEASVQHVLLITHKLEAIFLYYTDLLNVKIMHTVICITNRYMYQICFTTGVMRHPVISPVNKQLPTVCLTVKMDTLPRVPAQTSINSRRTLLQICTGLMCRTQASENDQCSQCWCAKLAGKCQIIVLI